VKKSGSNKGKIAFFKSGTKVRIRFLQELDSGYKIKFHDSFESGINVPCQELYDRECVHHDDEALSHRDNFAWSVWDHDLKEVRILLARVNSCSPIPPLVGCYEVYGTIQDRDYVITKNGTGMTTTYSVVPMDKSKFTNDKAKAFSKAKLMDIIDKAYPGDETDASDSDEDEKPIKKKRSVEEDEPVKKKKKVVVEDDEDEDDEPKPKKKSKKKNDDYEDMTAKELYLECIDRGISVKPKKDEDYYIAKLEDNDENGDESEEDEWS
jgi:hypothetical protein